MHSQLLARADLSRRAVADNEYLAGCQSRALLDFAKSRFFGQHIVAIGEIDFFDRRLSVQPEGFHFCVLDFGFAEADDEVPHAAFGKKAQ